MTRSRRGVGAPVALLVCGGLAILVPCAGAKTIAPFRAALSVRWGGGAGSDAFRDDLSRSLAETLATGCFASVVIADRDPVPADADIVLTVVLSEAVDETRFDDSIASTQQPREPNEELRRVARFAVTADATLSARATGALLYRKHFAANVSRRPGYVGEDPQATARAEAIDHVVVSLAKALGCGGARLERKIRDSLDNAGQAAPGPR